MPHSDYQRVLKNIFGIFNCIYKVQSPLVIHPNSFLPVCISFLCRHQLSCTVIALEEYTSLPPGAGRWQLPNDQTKLFLRGDRDNPSNKYLLSLGNNMACQVCCPWSALVWSFMKFSAFARWHTWHPQIIYFDWRLFWLSTSFEITLQQTCIFLKRICIYFQVGHLSWAQRCSIWELN